MEKTLCSAFTSRVSLDKLWSHSELQNFLAVKPSSIYVIENMLRLKHAVTLHKVQYNRLSTMCVPSSFGTDAITFSFNFRKYNTVEVFLSALGSNKNFKLKS